MAEKGYILTAQAVREIERVVRDCHDRLGNTANRPRIVEPLSQSPETFIAFTSGGIHRALGEGSGCTITVATTLGEVTEVTLVSGGSGFPTYNPSSTVLLALSPWAAGTYVGGQGAVVEATTNDVGIVTSVELLSGGRDYINGTVETRIIPAPVQSVYPSQNLCAVYQIVKIDDIGRSTLQRIGLNQQVVNLSTQAIPTATWFPVTRDKFGRWISLYQGGSYSAVKATLASKALTAGAAYTVEFGSVQFDTDTYWHSAEPTKFIVGAPQQASYSPDFIEGYGLYYLQGAATFEATYSGATPLNDYALSITTSRDGTVALQEIEANLGYDPGLFNYPSVSFNISTITRLTIGDYVQLHCIVSQGSPIAASGLTLSLARLK